MTVGNLVKITIAVAGMVAFASMPACAASGPYDPDHLGGDQVAQVAAICQSVMGLSPKEPQVWSIPLGSPHLDPGSSHYQACIAGLSDSLQNVDGARAARQADQDCRAKGFSSNSAALAECVLQWSETKSPSAAEQSFPAARVAEVKAGDTEAKMSSAAMAGNFFYASPRELRRREQNACARLGLEPPYGEFANCVERLETNFYAIDNPIN